MKYHSTVYTVSKGVMVDLKFPLEQVVQSSYL